VAEYAVFDDRGSQERPARSGRRRGKAGRGLNLSGKRTGALCISWKASKRLLGHRWGKPSHEQGNLTGIEDRGGIRILPFLFIFRFMVA